MSPVEVGDQRGCEGSQSAAQDIADAPSCLTRVDADKYHTKFTSQTSLTSLDSWPATYVSRRIFMVVDHVKRGGDSSRRSQALASREQWRLKIHFYSNKTSPATTENAEIKQLHTTHHEPSKLESSERKRHNVPVRN